VFEKAGVRPAKGQNGHGLLLTQFEPANFWLLAKKRDYTTHY